MNSEYKLYYKNWVQIATGLVKGKQPHRIILRDATVIYLPADADSLTMVDQIFFEKIYTPEILAIKKNDVVVDIGACIGIFTLFAAKNTKNKIYAFEPHPDNVTFLRKNISKNKLHNIIIHNAAVSNGVDPVKKLFIAERSSGHLLFDHNINGKLKKYIEVQAISLRNIIDTHVLSRIDFLKLDCEGSEGAILSSVPISYLKRIKKISMEFHDNVSILSHDDIIALLAKAGFKTVLRWDGRSVFGYIYGYQR